MKILGYFHLLDYSMTHNILLIRNTELIDPIVENNEVVSCTIENTDILFSSTFYIEIPPYFYNVEIQNGTREECDYVLSRCDPEFISSLEPEDLYTLITNGGKRYYVGARRLNIEKNSLNPSETSIGFKRFPIKPGKEW